MSHLNIKTLEVPIDEAMYTCGICGKRAILFRDGAEEIGRPGPCVCGAPDYWEVTDLRATLPDGAVIAMPRHMKRPWWVEVPVLIGTLRG